MYSACGSYALCRRYPSGYNDCVNKRGEHHHARIFFGVVFAFALFAFSAQAASARLFVTPGSGTFTVGKNFSVVIRMATDQAANAAEGTLSFDPAYLQVQSLSGNGSIFNLNVQQPEFSNSAGTVRFAGVILNPGFTGASGNLLTITFRPVAKGTTAVSFSSGAILANDGKGTNITAGLSGATYTIGDAVATPKPSEPQASTPVAPSSLLPDVTSPTHPDQTIWYANNDPEFKWPLAQGVDGVSYLTSAKKDANPGNESDGVASSVKFTDVSDGASYFHIKFRTKAGWGPIAHFGFNVDTGLPEPFKITRLDETDTTNPNPILSFTTTDAASGILRYAMKIGDGDWFAVDGAPTDFPFKMPHQSPGTRVVIVEAIDRAGNSSRATLSVTVKSITVPVITQYPARVPSGQTFQVSGTADPGVTVSVAARRSVGRFGGFVYDDSIAGTGEAQTDAVGRWTISMPVLKDAGYNLVAVATDRRMAVSDPSAPVSVRVGFGFIERMFEFFRAFPYGWSWISILAWLLLILAIILIVTGLRQRASRGIVGGLKRNEKKASDKLQELLEDINDELLLLAKVSKHRPLYPEEKYLRSKLLQYQRTIRFLVKNPRSRLAKRK